MDNLEQIDIMDTIINHFENEAKEFDDVIVKVIPHYQSMIEIMIAALPYNKLDRINVIDLGCGTGTVTLAIKQRFPNSRITCLDISDNMLKIASRKLSNYNDIQYAKGNFYDYEFQDTYDVVVSSLALHHLITDEDKKNFYHKIFQTMKNGGIFVNADIVLGPSMNIQSLYLQKWVEFMNEHCAMEEIQNKWLVNYQKEDSPTSLSIHFDLMREVGFVEIDVLWKHYNFCVYTGRRMMD